jgi:hypothetical protein
MRRYSDISNVYEGTAMSLYLVEGKKDKSINRYIRGHIGYIKSYLSKRGVCIRSFKTASPALFGKRSLKNLLLRQYPTLSKEELESRFVELKKENKEGHSHLYFILGTTFDEGNGCVADILCEDNFYNGDGYKEQLFRFFDEIASLSIRNERLGDGFRVDRYRYRLPDAETDIHYSNADNEELIGDEFLAKSICKGECNVISPIHFDSKFNISLPLYPQISIKLEPLPKSLYILFLQHPEGIILKDIQEYEEELKKIYCTISGRKNPSVINRVFKSVTNPLDNQLHRNLTIIRKCFTSKLNYEIAQNYIPGHNRARAHNIPIDTSLVKIPEII